MNKEELVKTISETTGVSKKNTTAVLEGFLIAVAEAMSKCEKVTLMNFGTFESRIRDARDCRDPKTGETIHVSAHRLPCFKPSQYLKNLMR